MSFGALQNNIDSRTAGRKAKCLTKVGNCVCNREFHSLVSNNIQVITFGMDETDEKRRIREKL